MTEIDRDPQAQNVAAASTPDTPSAQTPAPTDERAERRFGDPRRETPVWAQAETSGDRPFSRGLIAAGFAIIAVFGGTFYVWAASAPIEGAVIAQGVVSVDSNVRTIQHLEGGIIDAILVRDGDRVATGQVLIRLQNTLSSSTRNELQAQYFEMRATEARLVAEQEGKAEIAFPAELTDKIGDGAARASISGQESLFQSRRKLLADRLTILDRTKAGLESEITGLEGQIASSDKRLGLIAEELRDVEELYAKNLTNKPRLLQLQRQQAELQGEVSSYQAGIGTARQKIDESDLRMVEMQAAQAAEVADGLRDTRAKLYELHQRLTAAEDIVGRTEIRSPVDGIVKGLTVHTIGGVIAAGQPLMDVVPVSDKLVIQATLDPLDIDQVAEGQPAQVWLSAVNRRSQTPLDGIVTTVSADRMTDAASGAPYYQARVELDRAEVARSSVPMQPGMSAEVMIRTGARTTWDYLSSPISQFLSRAMREG
ncbi:HlyD family type I secretion periplasmic adaptor subunit [Paracoccus aminophilus]|uniref:Membrane fusion protein (MFP) family protein n=1 Tax=Paracoccus aminophilus JCM 7686 TaxID=1367847 RepID=S5XLV6_PARAH|nr:HlyD family type I secretion periplasmic adaptor subunit [Paracoccus aminophilus]AGT08234.1 alkaline protease secretion protein [Paracoccus aminophilus JCM 7686]